MAVFSKNRRFIGILVISILIQISPSITHAVTATGTGYNREQAVRNALRNAVEQEAGVYVSWNYRHLFKARNIEILFYCCKCYEKKYSNDLMSFK